jgi:hypothetical protein
VSWGCFLALDALFWKGDHKGAGRVGKRNNGPVVFPVSDVVLRIDATCCGLISLRLNHELVSCSLS